MSKRRDGFVPLAATEGREAPPLQRLALLLRYVDDLPVNEVARQLQRSVHATESLLVRARQALERLHRESLDG